MSEVNKADIYALAQGFRLQWEPAQNSHVLLYPEGMVKINKPAAAILSELDGERDTENVVNALIEKYKDEKIASDIYEFIEEAKGHGWIKRK